MARFITRVFLFVMSVVLFLAAVNTLTMTVSRFLWMMGILFTENGHWVAIGTAFFLVVSIRKANWKTMDGWLSPMFFAVSLVLFLRPVYLASNLEEGWRRDFEKEFGTTTRESWFSFWKAWGFDLSTPSFERRKLKARDGNEIAYDLYPGQGQGPHPVVIVVHGGGWDSGDSSQLPQLNGVLNDLGYTIASVDYRLAPNWKWPTQRQDVEDVMADLKAKSNELALDTSGFFLLGRSAGGQIAGATAFFEPADCVKGFVEFYAPTDLRFGYEVSSPDDWLEPMLLLEQFTGGSPTTAAEAYKTSSIVENVTTESPPSLLLHGRPDSLSWYKHAERLRTRMKAAGAKVYFLDLPWGHHGFDFFTHGPGGQVSTNAVVAFLESQKARCR